MRKQPLPGASLCRDGSHLQRRCPGTQLKAQRHCESCSRVKGKHTPVFPLEELVSDIKGVKLASVLLKAKGEISRTHLDSGAERGSL